MKIKIAAVTFFCFTALMSASASAEAPLVLDAEKSPENYEFKDRLDFASGLYSRSLYDMAAKEYAALIQDFPGHSHIWAAHYGLAETQFFAKNYEEALKSYRTFAKRFPGHEQIELAQQRFSESLYYLERFKEAKAAFSELLSAKQAAVKLTAHYYLGKIHYQEESWGEAEPFFRYVLSAGSGEENPYRAFTQFYLGEITFQKGDLENARGFFSELLTSKDADLKQRAFFGLGKSFFAEKKYREAHKPFMEVTQIDKNPRLREEAYLNILKSFYNLSAYEEFLTHYEKFKNKLENEDYKFTAKSLEARALRLLKRREEALAAYEALTHFENIDAARKTDSLLSYTEYLLDLGKVHEAGLKLAEVPGDGHDFEDWRHYLAGELARANLNTDEALMHYEAIIQEYPGSDFLAQASLQKSYLLIEEDKTEDAYRALTEFAEKNPEHELLEKALADRILISANSENWPRAIKDSLSFLNLYPEGPYSADTAFRLASMYVEVGEHDVAEAAYKEYLEKYFAAKPRPEIYFYMGYNRQLQGAFEAAVPYYEKMDTGKISGDIVKAALKNKAYSYMQLERYEEAIETYREIIQKFSGDDLTAEVFYWMADFYRRRKNTEALGDVIMSFNMRSDAASHTRNMSYYRGEWLRLEERCAEAEAEYQAGLDAESDFVAEIRVGLGECALQSENYETAAEHFKSAIGESRGDYEIAVRARMKLGQTHLLSEDYEKAGKSFFAVAILYDDPETVPEALFQAALAFKQAGDAAAYEQAYGELLSRYPDHELAKTARADMETAE